VLLVVVRLWVGRHLRDVDDYHERDYREPPAFTTTATVGAAEASDVKGPEPAASCSGANDDSTPAPRGTFGRGRSSLGLDYLAGMGPEWLVVALLVAIVIGIVYVVQRSRRPH
jgi:hypothetical protein